MLLTFRNDRLLLDEIKNRQIRIRGDKLALLFSANIGYFKVVFTLIPLPRPGDPNSSPLHKIIMLLPVTK